MAAAKLNPIYVDQLYQRLIESVNNEGSIEFFELSLEYPEFAVVPRDTLWSIVNSLAEEGYIRLERHNRALVLYSVEL
jgi:hypothetical protein